MLAELNIEPVDRDSEGGEGDPISWRFVHSASIFEYPQNIRHFVAWTSLAAVEVVRKVYRICCWVRYGV